MVYCTDEQVSVYMEVHYKFSCSHCGADFTWDDLTDNSMLCPYCNWDSVRIAKRGSTHNEDDWMTPR